VAETTDSRPTAGDGILAGGAAMHRPSSFRRTSMPSVPNSGPAAPPPPPVWDAVPRDGAPVRYAGFWLRVVAAIVDGFALGVVWQIISFAFPAPPPPPANPENFDAVLAYISTVMSPGKMITYALIVWAYVVFQ